MSGVFTAYNNRQLSWDIGTASAWNIRWRLIGDSAWNYSSAPLPNPPAIWGVTCVGQPYPDDILYQGILTLGNHYEVQVQAICGTGPDATLSSWSASLDFGTFLTCPIVDILSYTASGNTLTFNIAYNALGSTTYPIITFNWKKAEDMYYHQIPYNNTGSPMVFTPPEGSGTYAFFVTSQCTDDPASITTSNTVIYTF